MREKFLKGSSIHNHLGYTEIYLPEKDFSVTSGFTSDLLSDVMANAEEDSVLMTIQAHRNSVAVAALAGIRAIIICSGRKVPADMLTAAEEHAIALYTTEDNQFTASWKIADLLEKS
ncbi:MAG: iron-sulfur binding hydrogenase [Spirochaetia bacterium]|nr:iron-sulfur binding hydrogenase [Spirochaetia bacterium]